MKNLFLSVAFLGVFAGILSAQTVVVGSEEYNAMKAAGTLDNPGIELVDPEGLEVSIHPTVYPAGDGVEGRNINCGCWVEPDETYTQAAFPVNPLVDDGSTNNIPIPFTFQLYSDNYTSMYINTNGNITFQNPFTTYTSQAFPLATTKMVAPFWADVDLSCAGCGQVFYKITEDAVFVNWVNVGYFPDQTDKINNFQVIITDGNNDFVGAGRNVAFCYKDMQWTTGSASGGNNGCGGSPATVGANRGAMNQFIQFGRFDNCNTNTYDGPFGNNDGVNWLDNQTLVFNAATESNNVPPILNGLELCDTLQLCQGETTYFDIDFLAPENGQTTTIEFDDGGMLGINNVIITDGNTANITFEVTASLENLGVNAITLTATDNGTPAATTQVTIYLEVTDQVVPELTVSGPTGFCPGGSTTLVASEGFDEYLWSSGCTTPDCSFSNTQTVTVTASAGGCVVTSPPIEIIEEPYDIMDVTIANQPICSNDSTLVTAVDPYDQYIWAEYLDYPGTLYGPTDQQTVYASAGTFIVQGISANGCIDQRIFTIDATDATIPEDEWSGTYCEGLEELDFCCGYATAQSGNFWLYMFNTGCGWAGDNGSLDVFINGELVIDDVQAPNCNTSLWTPSTLVNYGDFIEVYYNPGNSSGTQTLSVWNCSTSPLDLEPVTLDPNGGLIWSGYSGCPSVPASGSWEVLSGPDGWSFSETNEFNSDFTPGDYGTYDLHFFSATCGIDYFYEVTYSATPSVSLEPAEYLLCDNASLTLEPVIDNPFDLADISWNTGQTSETLTVTESGTYCIIVANECGAPEACADVILEPTPQINVGDYFLLCDGASQTLDPIAADHPSYVYAWTGPGGFTSGANSITVSATGDYSVTVSNNCGAESADIEVVSGSTPVIDGLDQSYLLCGESSLALDPLSVDNPAYEYSWTGPGGFSSGAQDVTLSQNGSYTFSVSSVCGDDAATFDVTFVQDLTLSVNTLTLCDGVEGTLAATVNQSDVEFDWDNGGTGSSITVTQTGTYCVTVTNLCENQTECGDVVANVTPTVTVSPSEILLCPGVEEPITATTNTNALSYSWEQICGNSSTPIGDNDETIGVISEDIPGNCIDSFVTYQVTVSNICGSDSDEMTVALDPCIVEMPNIITPNGDDLNDTFTVPGLDNYLNLSGGVVFKVFNRWGNLVYETNDYDNKWNGADVPSGTYFFLLALPNGIEYNGPLTILRD